MILTKEIIEKRNQSNKGKIISDETRKRISESNIGRKCSEETKEKLRNANLGKKYSEETKKKLSEMRTGEKNHRFGKTNTEEHNMKCLMNNPLRKEITQYTKLGEFIRDFLSSHEAERETGLSRKHIVNCCKKRKSCNTVGGFVFRYKGDIRKYHLY